MSEKRSVFLLRPTPHLRTLQALARLVGVDPKAVQDGDLAVQVVDETLSRIVIPSTRLGGHRITNEAKALRIAALEAYTSDDVVAGGRSTESPREVETGGLWSPLAAALWIVARDQGGTVDPGHERLVIVQESIAENVAETVRAGRDVRILQTIAGPAAEVTKALLVNDDPEDKSLLLPALVARGTVPGVEVLYPREAGGHRVWLPKGLVPRGEALAAFSAVASSLGPDGSVQYAAVPGGRGCDDDLILILQDLAAAPALTGAADEDQIAEQFDLVTLTMAPATDETLDALVRQIGERDLSMGYKLSLTSARTEGTLSDIEFIRDEIRKLEGEIDNIQAQERPNTRLMRFTDAQLPAMIDVLRRLHPKALLGDAVKYTAGHYPGEAGPIHYLIYDPEDENLRIVEAIWQTETGDTQPMSFWMDPLVADATANRDSAARFRLFVPQGKLLTPSPAHFGGDLDETMELIFGRLHGRKVPFIGEDAARPVAVFWPSPSGASTKLSVEVFDARYLQPIKINLPWMNDYLQMEAAKTLDREALADVATELYEGDAVAAHLDPIKAKTQEITDHWQSVQDDVRDDALEMLSSIAAEVEAGQEHIKASHSYLVQAGQHIRALEGLIRAAESQLRRAAMASDTIESVDLGMRRASDAFAKRVEVETAEGEAQLDKLKELFDDLDKRLTEVKARRGKG